LAVVAGPQGASTTQQRLSGFRTALARAGVAVHDDCWRFTDGSAIGGYHAARELLADCAPDGVLAFNTLLAEGVLTALHQIPVEQRPALAGFDVPQWASLAGLPYVCSARQPVQALAEHAAAVLLEWMDKGVMPHAQEELPLAVGPVLPALEGLDEGAEKRE
jgi:LacI family transcriptional regulator